MVKHIGAVSLYERVQPPILLGARTRAVPNWHSGAYNVQLSAVVYIDSVVLYFEKDIYKATHGMIVATCVTGWLEWLEEGTKFTILL